VDAVGRYEVTEGQAMPEDPAGADRVSIAAFIAHLSPTFSSSPQADPLLASPPLSTTASPRPSTLDDTGKCYALSSRLNQPIPPSSIFPPMTTSPSPSLRPSALPSCPPSPTPLSYPMDLPRLVFSTATLLTTSVSKLASPHSLTLHPPSSSTAGSTRMSGSGRASRDRRTGLSSTSLCTRVCMTG
jgi:hypothetical protein